MPRENYVVIDFQDVALQDRVKEVSTLHGMFSWIIEGSGFFDVRERTSSNGNPDHYLYAYELNTHKFAVRLTLAKPASRISYAPEYPTEGAGGLANAAALVHLSNDSTATVSTEAGNLYIDYTAPAELSIKSVDFLMSSRGTALDNIKLYE